MKKSTKFFSVLFYVLTVIFVLVALGYICIFSNFIAIVVFCVYMFCYAMHNETQRHYYIYGDEYLELYKRYEFYKENKKYLPQDIQDKIHDMNSAKTAFEEDFDNIVEYNVYILKNK